MPLTLFLVVVLSTYPEASWLAGLMVAQEPTRNPLVRRYRRGYGRPYCMKSGRAPARNLALALQGTLTATPPAREAIPALLAVLKVLFDVFRFRGG